jgi:hypothetical protein
VREGLTVPQDISELLSSDQVVYLD